MWSAVDQRRFVALVAPPLLHADLYPQWRKLGCHLLLDAPFKVSSHKQDANVLGLHTLVPNPVNDLIANSFHLFFHVDILAEQRFGAVNLVETHLPPVRTI